MAFLFLGLIISGCGVSSADKFYNGFKNPPVSAGPLARWDWDAKGPTKNEIINRLNALKKEGFGIVEIRLTEGINAKAIKFAVSAAKRRGMLVDLAFGPTFTIPNLRPEECSQTITLGKKTLTGPTTLRMNVNDLIDANSPNRRLMFLRLIPQGLKSFQPGIELIDKIRPDGLVAFDIPDGNNFTFYSGVLHEKFTPAPIPDLLNKQTVEKYFNEISANLGSAFSGKLGDSIHAISFDDVDLSGANWTGDFAEQFSRRRGYDLAPYLPVVLDSSLPKERTRFYDTTRRVRYDFCLTVAELFNENFIESFRGWCRDNGFIPRFNTPDVNMLLALKSVAGADSILPDIFFDGDPFLIGRSGRLSYLFRKSMPRSQIAILLPIADVWSDCGLYRSRCPDYIWYLSGLRQALNHNGYTADYITEQALSQSTYDDGKLHFGSQTWDAVVVPDVCSIEFPAAKTLRFFAKAGGKIAFIGGYPNTSPGFKDLLQRTIPIQITMEHIQNEFKDRALVFLSPKKDKDNLASWAAEITAKLGILPAVKISPASDSVLFAYYTADNRDIFFFTNTNRTEQVSFNAQFNTADKTPTVWDPKTGNRSVFPYGENKDTLNINLKPLESILLVFEPDSKGKH